MKTVAIIALLALGACSALPAATRTQLACTGSTITEASRGDFSRWVLPDFVPGRHLRAGQRVDCMP